MDPSSSLDPYCSYKRKRDDDEPFNCCKRPKHDVFLSYSNEDIGKSFVSHLKGALERNGFDISDNTTLPIGQDESSGLLKAIEESWICVVVFSIKYPFSVKCLDELVLIMDSISKSNNRKVVPIFFKVDPSHVRSQQHGSFLEAFQAHHDNRVDCKRVEKWKHALKDVGDLAGQPLQTWENEEEFVRKILKMLGKLKLPLELFDADHPVGIKPRAQDLISELRLGDPDPSITAVLGISGSGKTTLVKAVYDTIVADFDANCFIENIRYLKGVNGPNSMAALQQLAISHLTRNDCQLQNIASFANIRKFVNGRKVLLILDDVDKYEQLEALGIHHRDSFGCGSRIIVTTTNKQSLSGLQKYTSYHINLLDKSESFQLFVRLAYGKGEPVDEKFVAEIVRRAGGLPLVLKVWGPYFKSHESKQWPRLLEKLRRIPHEDVQKKLQVSYDSLSPRAKNLFLDIACFFDGMKKDLVIKVLQDEDSAFFPDIEIQDLMDKGLVKEHSHILTMHDVTREMGLEVVRQENEDDPGQRSRLVDHMDVVRVLRDCWGTDSVKSIYLDWANFDELETVQVEAAFRKLSNLRFIHLVDYDYGLQWSSYNSCSNDEIIKSPLCFKHLKYLEWNGFPFKCLDNFHMGRNVVVIKLRDSKLEILWEGALKSLKKLRILDVRHSSYLIRTGNFIGLENLEELRLRECEKLEELDTSIGCLQKLVTLNLWGCTELKRVPWEMIGKLTSLVTLKLRDCHNILNISHELGNLKSLKYLRLEGNSFPRLPDSLCQLHQLIEISLSLCDNLKSIPNLPPNIQDVVARDCRSLVSLPSNMSELQFLTTLWLDNCEELGSEGFVKVTGLRNLEELRMINCNASQVSSEIGNLVSLKYLYLSENTFRSLPDSISNLSRLDCLEINDCRQLELLPLLPSKLSVIEACGCWSLDVMPLDSRQMGYVFRSQWCRQLLIDSQLEPSELFIKLSWKEEVVIPEWYGKELCFVAPITTQLNKKICGVILCSTQRDSTFSSRITMLNKTKETSHQVHVPRFFYDIRPSMYVGFYPLKDETLVVEVGDTLIIKFINEVSCCGVSWIYEDDVVDDGSAIVFINC